MNLNDSLFQVSFVYDKIIPVRAFACEVNNLDINAIKRWKLRKREKRCRVNSWHLTPSKPWGHNRWPYPQKRVTLILFMKFWSLYTCKEHSFSFQWYQNYANLPIGSNVIDKSIWLPQRVPFWEIGLRKFVSHTTVLQQLQFKMPETVMKPHIWPL